MVKRARDLDLVLHIGLHKTATSYVQNLLSAARYDLMREGILYPMTGTVEGASQATREGAQSGHALFTRRGQMGKRLLPQLLEEVPASCSTVLLSSENFTLWHRAMSPSDYLAPFKWFRTVKVVLVLRRQDDWIESYYKQIVDGYRDFETRSFADFLKQDGARLLDFHQRFTPWRDIVGPDNFHVVSYDDVGASGVCREILRVAGSDGSVVQPAGELPLPRYASIRPIDTVGLRILNSYRLQDRDRRIAVAKSVYSLAPKGDIALMTPEIRAGIQDACSPVNEQIEAEWFGGTRVPGFRFGQERDDTPPERPVAQDVIDYVGEVMSLCDAARAESETAEEAKPRGTGKPA